MRRLTGPIFLLLLIGAVANGQDAHGDVTGPASAKSPLEVKISRFNITDAILREGISELSLKNVDGLHVGFEEITRNKIEDDPRAQGVHFSLHMEGKSIREIIYSLCEADSHYTWSEDGASINVYPRATRGDPSYLLNLGIDRIAVYDIPDPEQGLTPLSKLFPEQQVGYAGGEGSYSEPWTATFQHLTVRQFINRMTEHMGSHTSWVWQGGKEERMFTFVKGGFHTIREPDKGD